LLRYAHNLLKRFNLVCLLLMLGGGSLVQAQSLPATITLNAGTVLNSFVPLHVFGVNTQFWANGYNSSDSGGVPVKTKLQKAGSYFLRYPGGSSSDTFHWNGTGNWIPAADGSLGVTSGYWVPSSTTYSAGFQCYDPRIGSTSANAANNYSVIDDGSLATTWLSNVDTDYQNHQWVYLRLGNTAVNFDSVTISWGSSYATSFQVQYWTGAGTPVQSGPESAWTNTSAATVTGTGGVQGVSFTSVSSQYVRLLMTASSASVTANLGAITVTGPAYAIAELKVYNGTTAVSNNVATTGQSQATASSMDPVSSKQYTPAFDFNTYMTYLNTMSPAGIPLITINMGTGTPQEAAAWVHYANAVQGYQIRYWEIGNEMDGQWETGGPLNADDYGRRYLEFYNAMQAEASTDGVAITILGPVCSSPFSNPNSYNNSGAYALSSYTSGNDFIPVFLNRLATDPGGNQLADAQGIVFHWYPADTGNYTTAIQIPGYYNTLTGWLATAGHPGASTIPLFMDEYNINAGTPHITVQIQAGLWLANWLGNFLTSFGSRGYANFWTTINGGNDSSSTTGGDLGYIDNSTFQEHATYWAMQMMAADWAVAGDTQAHQLVSASSSVGSLVSYADMRPDGKLALLAVNESLTNTYDTILNVSNFTPASAATGWRFDASNYAFQTTTLPYNASPDTAPTTVTYSNVSGSFPVTFGPSSINVIQLVSGGSVATATPTPTAAACMVGGFTCTPTFTQTPSPTVTITFTPTVTLTPTITNTPNPGSLIPFPNPTDGKQPISFFYNVTGTATEVDLRVFTVANRLIFKDLELGTGVGQHTYSLNWVQRGLDPANGLYYFVLDIKNNGQRARQIMKVLVRR
jgi:hypothetical protein